MKKLLPFLFAAAILAAAHALDFPAGVSLEPDGRLKLGDAELLLTFADCNWKWCENSHWTHRKSDIAADSGTVTGDIAFGDGTGRVSQTLRQLGGGTWKFESRVSFSKPVDCKTLCATLRLPVPAGKLTVDGREISLPEVMGERVLRQTAPARSVFVELAGGLRLTISGNLSVMVQDDRRWVQTASVRVYFTPSQGEVKDSALEFKLELSAPAAVPVDLAGAANRTFADPDGSGWTGQGSGNDLSWLKSGRVEYAGFPFMIGLGKKAVVVGRIAPQQAKLMLTGTPAGAVNLLHASAWPPPEGEPLGFLDVEYDNGKMESIPVRSGIDCGNWWTSQSFPNAAVAVSDDNLSATTGLYASSFRLSGERLKSITFRSAAPKSCWMIAAVTLSDRVVAFPRTSEKPLVMRENANWKPLWFDHEVLADSPLDFSGGLDAPAGKYGFVRVSPEGWLTFEKAPEKRLRLLGVNLCRTGGFPDKAVVDRLVEHLARLGYNSVRIHHHDHLLVDSKAPDSVTLDPDRLDRLDYLFAKFKERGFYITTDLFTSRILKSGDGIPGAPEAGEMALKALIPIDRAAMENWKTFARKWMTHRNPYTGLSWGEDPALFCINLSNEDPLAIWWNRFPKTKERYIRKFEEWKKDRPAGGIDVLYFLDELQAKALDEQLDFVRRELGMKTLATSLNCGYSSALTPLREKFDLVDNHQYFAHPTFPETPWSLPHGYDQGSAIRRNAILPRLVMPSRIFGKPFLITEFNYCTPNVFRAEGGPLLGAYAALQDWDGLWRFAWTHKSADLEHPRQPGCFDGSQDPMQQFSDRIIRTLFVCGDLSPAKEKIALEIPGNPYDGSGTPPDFPEAFSSLGLNARIGSYAAGSPLPQGVRRYRPGERVSADSQVILDRSAGTFAVATPFSETVTLPRGELAAKLLRVKKADTFMTVAAISLDRRPLAGSRSVLVIHLTDVANTGMHFGNGAKTRLIGWGTLPLLLRRGTAEIEISTDSSWRVTALRTDGAPLGRVASDFQNGIFHFRADSFSFPEGVIAYHLSKD